MGLLRAELNDRYQIRTTPPWKYFYDVSYR